MKRYKLHVRQAALDEAEEIRSWYEEQSGGLGGPIPVRVGCLLRGPDQESAPANAQGAFPVHEYQRISFVSFSVRGGWRSNHRVPDPTH